MSDVIPSEHEKILTKKCFGHVATIGPDGEPQSSPVWVDYDGTNLRISQNEHRQKLHNLRRNPEISISATDPDDPYHYLEVRGKVADIQPDEGYAFINALANKYLGQDYPYLQPGEQRVVVSIRPTHTTSQG